MTHRFEGLHLTLNATPEELPEGWYLVRVAKARYCSHRQKPFYVLQLTVEEPGKHSGERVFGRLDCTAKALWKLAWFLRDFGYDSERLPRDEVDETSMAGLRGVVRITPLAGKDLGFVHFDGFAPREDWQKLSTAQSAGKKALRSRVTQ